MKTIAKTRVAARALASAEKRKQNGGGDNDHEDRRRRDPPGVSGIPVKFVDDVLGRSKKPTFKVVHHRYSRN